MKKLVLFDFDGVLVNTLKIWFTIHKEANNDFTWESFQAMSEGNFWDKLDESTKQGHILPDNAEAKYLSELVDTTFSIEEAISIVIKALHEKYQIAIVSSGRESSINQFLKKMELDYCFSDVLGLDTHRSKTVKIKSLIDKYSLPLEHIIFITDTLGDIREANDCNVKSIGVTWGLHHRETLEKGEPFAILDDPLHLLETIDKALE